MHRRYRSKSQPGMIRVYKTNRVVQGHAVAVRDSSQGRLLTHYVEDSSILDKQFGKADDKITTLTTSGVNWSAKQRDFFNGERRFIFGVKDQ